MEKKYVIFIYYGGVFSPDNSIECGFVNKDENVDIPHEALVDNVKEAMIFNSKEEAQDYWNGVDYEYLPYDDNGNVEEHPKEIDFFMKIIEL